LNRGENPAGISACPNAWPIKTAQMTKKDAFLIFWGDLNFEYLMKICPDPAEETGGWIDSEFNP
jgi:hypothetical protein